MSSPDPSRTPRNYSSDKSPSSSASNTSVSESDISMHTTDIDVNEHPYPNTPSSSSSPSMSTSEPLFKFGSTRLRDAFYSTSLPPKHRYRYDKLFHLTHTLNRQYVVAMTNIIYRMQKEIYKLKKRTYNMEQKLAQQKKPSHPVIRIPRLTKADISSGYVVDSVNQQNVSSKFTDESENGDGSMETRAVNIRNRNEFERGAECSIRIWNQSPANDQSNDPCKQLSPKTKFCSRCRREFSHRSAYLRHMRKIHHGNSAASSNDNRASEYRTIRSELNGLTRDQSIIYSETDNAIEHNPIHLLVNQWDIGEGRLRPRPTSKSNHDPINKVKCATCNKFYRAEYIKKHKRRAHGATQKLSSKQTYNDLNATRRTTTIEAIDEIHTTCSESSTNNTNPPSTITVVEMETDELPIRFSKDASKPIIMSVTCLDRFQQDIIDEFQRKFSHRVSQNASIDSHTTHLITNDDKHKLHSPLSMKLIQAIANHCFCVSYRWIVDCLKYDRIVDETAYEIEGDDTNCHGEGGPRRSRTSEKHRALFENICFMIKCTENTEIKMTNDRLQDLITTCGGQIITCVTQSLLDQYEIVVLCDKLYVSERRHNYDQCRSLGINFVSSDWVLESILEYTLKPFSLYEETPL